MTVIGHWNSHRFPKIIFTLIFLRLPHTWWVFFSWIWSWWLASLPHLFPPCSDLLLLAVPRDRGLRVVRRPAAISGGPNGREERDRLPQLQHLPHPLEGDWGKMSCQGSKHLEWPAYEANRLFPKENKQHCKKVCESCCYGLFICLFALAGGSLPSSSRGRKRSNHRPQTEDSLWETQLGQRVHQYHIKAPGVSPLAVTLSLSHTHAQAEKRILLTAARCSGQD